MQTSRWSCSATSSRRRCARRGCCRSTRSDHSPNGSWRPRRRPPPFPPEDCVMTRLVDLSQDIYEGMQVYPGHLKTVTFQHVTHAETKPRFTSEFSFQTWG